MTTIAVLPLERRGYLAISDSSLVDTEHGPLTFVRKSKRAGAWWVTGLGGMDHFHHARVAECFRTESNPDHLFFKLARFRYALEGELIVTNGNETWWTHAEAVTPLGYDLPCFFGSGASFAHGGYEVAASMLSGLPVEGEELIDWHLACMTHGVLAATEIDPNSSAPLQFFAGGDFPKSHLAKLQSRFDIK